MVISPSSYHGYKVKWDIYYNYYYYAPYNVNKINVFVARAIVEASVPV